MSIRPIDVMAIPLKSTHFFIFLLLVSNIFTPIISFGSTIDQEREEFYEELLLRPLPDRKVLAHFHFQSTAPSSNSNGRHHHLFPKAISQLDADSVQWSSVTD
ncbi:hypothetical protein GH714_026085 [Hevea brasiliensis]|uniref:Uncharacterized protein n=1 Tax=Hevea brasiliensis TaxID=3981 RepID=A0A6A6KUD1_HEVBR|nr:hypothetical protein GH714_026085 [Hevea brasiliensis]